MDEKYSGNGRDQRLVETYEGKEPKFITVMTAIKVRNLTFTAIRSVFDMFADAVGEVVSGILR